MLDFFRQKGLSNVIYGVIIIATILVFVIQFRPNANQKTAPLSEQCAARVRGACITPKDQMAAYFLLMPRGPQGEPLPDRAKKMHLKQVALDGLIERELLIKEADRLGLATSEQEVTDELFNGILHVSVPSDNVALAGQLPSYKLTDFRDPKTHEVNEKVYKRKVKELSGRSEAEFRKEQEREILAAKMRDLVRVPVRVSEDEAFETFVREKSIATVRYIDVKAKYVLRYGVSVRDEDVAAWAKDHQTDIDKEVESRKASDLPKEKHLRQIFAAFPVKNPSPEEKAATLAKISIAWARLKSGVAVPEVARELGDDQAGGVGGDLGTEVDTSMGPAFKKAAEALKPGETTAGAVETTLGYHILAKDDPAKSAEVEASIKRVVPRELYSHEKATEATKDIADRIIASMKTGKSAEEAIKAALLPLVKPAQSVTPVPVIAEAPAPAAADGGAATPASSGKDGGTGGAGGATAANPDKMMLAPKPFTADADPDRPQAHNSSQFNKVGDAIEELDNPTEQRAIVLFAFSGKEGEVMNAPVPYRQGMFVIQLKDQKPVTREDFDKDKDTQLAQLLRAKQAEALSLYVKRLREANKSDIKIENPLVDVAKDGGPSEPSDEDEGY